MSLYLISDTYDPNTAPTNRVLAFHKGFCELGYSPSLVFIFPNYNKDKALINQDNANYIYLWNNINIKNKYFNYLFILIRFLSFVIKLKKDDIVIHYGPIDYLFIMSLNKKIRIFHERTECPEIIGRSFGVIGKVKYKIYVNACKRLNGIFTISPSLNHFFVYNMQIPQNKVFTINMIVDSSRFSHLDKLSKSNTNQITYCGTISEKKDGISYLITAFNEVLKVHNDYSLVIAGGFENNITRDKINGLIKSYNLEDKIKIIGNISADLMPDILFNSKILVLSRPTSKQAQYGFPTKLGEYLMTANPVVITNVGDFELYLRDKIDVVFAEPDDSQDFAKKILWVIDNYLKSKIIGESGRQIALKKFNYKIETQKIIEIINKY